jgi:threonine/homoserine/homoserine lactone efflux protein
MNLFTFLLAVLLLELTPGPNMAYLAILSRYLADARPN